VRRGITVSLSKTNKRLHDTINRYVEFVDGYYQPAIRAYESGRSKLLGSILK
jgi:hypothetical protein